MTVVHYGHPTERHWRAACGNGREGRGRQTNVKEEVTCVACKRSLQWKSDWYADEYAEPASKHTLPVSECLACKAERERVTHIWTTVIHDRHDDVALPVLITQFADGTIQVATRDRTTGNTWGPPLELTEQEVE